jgi:hypothetical protein
MTTTTPNFTFQIGQQVCFGRTNKVWSVVNRQFHTTDNQPQYFLETTDNFPKYHH